MGEAIVTDPPNLKEKVSQISKFSTRLLHFAGLKKKEETKKKGKKA